MDSVDRPPAMKIRGRGAVEGAETCFNLGHVTEGGCARDVTVFLQTVPIPASGSYYCLVLFLPLISQ